MRDEFYRFTNGHTMRREGNNLFWHLRDEAGGLVDKDRYRHDLICRWRLTVAEHHDPTALAIEAQRAETGTGSVHESAGPKDNAQ